MEPVFFIARRTRRATDEKGVEGHDKRPLTTERRGDDKRPLMNRRAQVSSLDAMADTAMGPAPLERQESVPMEIMNKCAYGEPSTKTIMVMGAVAAVLASITVYCIVSWARRSARAKFKAMIKSVFEEVDHDHGGTVDSDELYTAVLLVYLQVREST